MLVEDTSTDERLIRELLSEAARVQFYVTSADSLRSATAHLRRQETDAILLDLTLPDSTGIETFTQLYQEVKSVPIVVLTGIADRDLALRAVKLGAQDYLAKNEVDTNNLERSLLYAIERKRAEVTLAEHQRQLMRSERLAAIGEMVTGLAHEIRNALQRSQACLDMLAHRVQDQPKAVELVKRIQSAQDHLYHLYEQVRHYSAPIRLDRQPKDLGAVIDEVWEDLQHQRHDREATLNQSKQEFNLICSVDPHAARQVFRNVLENALPIVLTP